jgi:hypothetical protein
MARGMYINETHRKTAEYSELASTPDAKSSLGRTREAFFEHASMQPTDLLSLNDIVSSTNAHFRYSEQDRSNYAATYNWTLASPTSVSMAM